MDAEIDRWYHRKRWKARAAHQLKIEPLCRMCKERGKIEPACVVDHVERHNGDLMKFVFGEVQSLCIDCHNRTKQQIEVLGYSRDIGPDGFPIDRRHPFWAT